VHAQVPFRSHTIRTRHCCGKPTAIDAEAAAAAAADDDDDGANYSRVTSEIVIGCGGGGW